MIDNINEENVINEDTGDSEDYSLDFEEFGEFGKIAQNLAQEIKENIGDESFYFTLYCDTSVFVVYPYRDYIKIGTYKDELIKYFSSLDQYKDKNIYIISGKDIKNNKARWFKSERVSL